MLDNFVNQAAMMFYQTRRLVDVQRDLFRTEDTLKRLRDAGWLISSRLGLQQTLETILQMALDMTGASYGIFRLTNAEGNALITRAFAGAKTCPRWNRCPLTAAVLWGGSPRIANPFVFMIFTLHHGYRFIYPLYADLRMRSELAVPLIGASGRLEGRFKSGES